MQDAADEVIAYLEGRNHGTQNRIQDFDHAAYLGRLATPLTITKATINSANKLHLLITNQLRYHCATPAETTRIVGRIRAGNGVTGWWDNGNMKRFVVAGKYDRHVRKFWIYADSQAQAEIDAGVLVKYYATGTKNYTTDTWRFGVITVKEVGDAAPAVIIRGSRPRLQVVR